MPRQTKAQLEEQIRDLKRWYDELACQYKEAQTDLYNATTQNVKLTKEKAELEDTIAIIRKQIHAQQMENDRLRGELARCNANQKDLLQ